MVSFLQAIIDSIRQLVEWGFEMLKVVVYWLAHLAFDFFSSVWSAVGLPGLVIPAVDPALVEIASAANYWVPLEEAWLASITYVGLWLTLIGVRFMLKVGGLLTMGGW